MSTAFTEFYPVMRALLGDRQVHGLWHYPDGDLLSALRSVFMLGRGPRGYAMEPATASGAAVAPEVSYGDAFALLAYEACFILIGGEDGKLSYRTRSLSVTDGGERKRDLMFELGGLIHEIRNGGAYFRTYQSLAQWAGVARNEGGLANPAYIELQVEPPIDKISIGPGGVSGG